ncbi:hypothetical protein [Streptomyces sp. NPDC002845]
MPTESAHGPVEVICPGCGASGVRTVPEACADPVSEREGLTDRLAMTPEVPDRLDSLIHFLEGMVLAGLGGALAYSGVTNGEPLHTTGGSLLAVLLFFGTLWVIRGEIRERSVVAVGEGTAEKLWRPAYYCPSCASVFCPGGTPWQGLLTPEQFKQYVWTEAGFEKRLEAKVKDVELPPGTPTRPGGSPNHA